MKLINTALFTFAAAVMTANAGTSLVSGKDKTVVPPPPVACDIAYNYGQIFYGHGEYQGKTSSNGVNVQFSYSPVEHLFVTAGAGWDNVDGEAESFNDWGLHAGIGGYIAIAPAVHLGLEVGGLYTTDDSNGNDFGDGEWAGYVKPHVRICAGRIEAKLGVELTTLDVDQQWMVQTEFIFKNALGPADFAAGIDFNGNVQFYNAGIRFRF